MAAVTRQPETVVSSISDLATLQVADGVRVHFRGYDEGGRGARTYIWDADSNETVDGGYILDGPGATGRWVLSLPSRVITPLHYADPATTTDWETAIEAAAQAAKDHGLDLVLPYLGGDGYTTTDTVTFPAGINVWMDDKIFPNTAADAEVVAIQYGEPTDGVKTENKVLRLWAQRDNVSDWQNEDDIGILLYNLQACQVYIPYSSFFCRNVVLQAHEDPFVFNQIFLGRIIDGKVGVDLVPNGTGAAGYVNQNVFYGGNFQRSSSTNILTEAIGVRLSDGTGTAAANGNVFYAPSFEIGGPNDLARAVLFNDANVDNRILDARWEGSGTTVMEVASGVSARRNFVTLAFTDVDQVDSLFVSDAGTIPGTNWVISGRDAEAGMRPVYSSWRSVNFGRYATVANQAGGIHIPGIHFADRFAATRYLISNETGYTLGDDYIQTASGDLDAMGVYVEGLDKCKTIRVSCSLASSTKATWVVVCYDSSGSILSGSSPKYAAFPGASTTTGWGGGYFRNQGADGAMIINFHEDVASAEILLTGNGQTPQIRSMDVAGLDRWPITVRSWFRQDTGHERWAETPPNFADAGDYDDGEFIRNSGSGVSANEVQKITLGVGVTGTFTISFDGTTTSSIDADATAGEVQTILETSLVSVHAADAGTGKPADITVSGGPLPGSPITLTFDGNYANRDVPQVTCDSSGLSGGTATPSTTSEGNAGDDVLGWRKHTTALFPFWFQVPSAW